VLRWALLLIVPFLAGCGNLVNLDGPVAKPAASSAYPKSVAKVDDSRITESSGLAASNVFNGEFYTHNDSGAGPDFYRFNLAGKLTASFRLANAKNVDWEDMASAVIKGQKFLYFADIGDNGKKRSSVVIYRVVEPTGDSGEVQADQIVTVRYTSGAVNAEAFMVHPQTGDFYLCTKVTSEKSTIYRLPNPSGTGSFAWEKVGQVDVGGFIKESRRVTGGAISPDGKTILLRTYLSAYEFKAPASFKDWANQKPTSLKTNIDLQGESIAFSADGKNIFTTSEGSPMLISQLR